MKKDCEFAKTKIRDFTNAQLHQWGQRPEEVQRLTKIQQAMIGKHLLMKIKGKHNRLVDAFIPKKSENALMLLLEHREAVGVDKENQYLFPGKGLLFKDGMDEKKIIFQGWDA